MKNVRVLHGVFFLFAAIISSCIKEDVSTRDARLKAPERSYSVTARIDNKEANNDSEARGMLKGTYDESTMSFTYTISFEGVNPKAIMFKRGPRGSAGTLVWKVRENDAGKYKAPVSGKTILTALQERDLLKGTWFITVDSESRSPEIRGIITLKQK